MSKKQKTIGNYVMVRMDADNDFITMESGIKLYIDIEHEPEKHMVRTGLVTGVPERLHPGDTDMPWDTDMELRIGDKVIMYYLAIQNCLAPEQKRYSRDKETGEVSIYIKYHNIFAAVRDGQILPLNGYILVESIEDPAWIEQRERAAKQNIELPDMRELSKTHVSYGRIVYIGKPNRSYSNPTKSDAGIDIYPGDEVAIKKIRDIPMEYEYHAKIDGGRKLLRMQRHDILAIL